MRAIKKLSRFICCPHLHLSSARIETGKLGRLMATGSKQADGLRDGSDHLTRTSDHTRKEVISMATVTRVQDESKTVKLLTLKIQDDQLTFKAGQWLDVFIPGVETVGGFSMCSSPCKLVTCRELDLAVKYIGLSLEARNRGADLRLIFNGSSAYSNICFYACDKGSQLRVRVGGDFHYDPVSQAGVDLLLIAGGVGINPLISILNHVTDVHGKGDNEEGTVGRVMLLYSSGTLDELVFKEQLDAIVDKDERIACRYFTTQEQGSPTPAIDSIIRGQRIANTDLSTCFEWLRKDQTLAYICGPSGMISDMEDGLLSLGLDKHSIMYEKWW